MSQNEWKNPTLFFENIEKEKKKQNDNKVTLGPPAPSKCPTDYRPAHPGGNNVSEPGMKLGAFFILIEPDESKLAIVGVILLFIFVSLIVLYFLFRFGARSKVLKEKDKDKEVNRPAKLVKNEKPAKENPIISPVSMQEMDDLGGEAAGYHHLIPSKK